MTIGNIYRTTVIYSNPLADGEVVNIIDYEQTTTLTTKTEANYCLELAAEVKNITVDEYMPIVTDTWTLERVECFNIDQPTFFNQVSIGQVGGVGGATVAIRSAPVVTKFTGLRGRSFRGRNYLLSPNESQQDSGELSVLHQTGIDDYFALLKTLNISSGNDYRMVVYSAKLSTGTRVTSSEVKTTLGTIKGRRKVTA